jgi:hypothetical protein
VNLEEESETTHEKHTPQGSEENPPQVANVLRAQQAPEGRRFPTLVPE